jgi:transposase-like protein
MVDGTELKRHGLTLLIAANGETGEPIFWMPVVRESAETWEQFFGMMHAYGAPEIIICDGQKGLLKAAGTVFPSTRIQRCMTHVIRYAKGRLTQHPKMKAGQELLVLVNQLSSIQTLRQKRRWILAFRRWKRRHATFMKEKTVSPSGKWWYTHRMLRGIRTLLENATPDLFRFIRYPKVPKTSNRVEGGLNARCKELIRCHRGTSLKGKLILCCWYLSKRQG